LARRDVHIFVISQPCLFRIYTRAGAAPRPICGRKVDNGYLIEAPIAMHNFLPQFHVLTSTDRQREVFHHLQLPDVGFSEHGPR
jgi:hypothetical protein